MNLTATVRRENSAAVVDLSGRIDRDADEAFDEAWSQCAGADEVTLNFESVDYINSSGIALIVGLLTKARTTGTKLRAFGLSDHYREIFEITRLSDFIAIDEKGRT